jgi:hypothetical protein
VRPPEVPGSDQLIEPLIIAVPVRVRLDPAELIAALITRVQLWSGVMECSEKVRFRYQQRVSKRTVFVYNGLVLNGRKHPRG